MCSPVARDDRAASAVRQSNYCGSTQLITQFSASTHPPLLMAVMRHHRTYIFDVS
jgi:hypothetical protein